MNRKLETETKSLNPASFSTFIGEFHDHEKEIIELKAFKIPV